MHVRIALFQIAHVNFFNIYVKRNTDPNQGYPTSERIVLVSSAVHSVYGLSIQSVLCSHACILVANLKFIHLPVEIH